MIPSRGIGSYKIASQLRMSGYSVQVIDFTDWFSSEELIETVSNFIGENTKLIGISSTFYQVSHYPVDKRNVSQWLQMKTGIPQNIWETFDDLKKRFPHIKYVLGGANSYLVKDLGYFDAVFHGYSDNSILDYMNYLNGSPRRLWKRIDKCHIIEGEDYSVDVEHLKHRWEENDFIFPKESLPIEISRGCIFKCKFCNFQLTGKKKFDYIRNIDLIKEELIDNYERFGTTNYMFTDDTFNDSTYKLELIHRAITDLPFKINFTTYLRLDLLHSHPEQIPMLREMGLRSAFFGIESMNEKTAKAMGKGLKVEKVKETLLRIKNEDFKENFSMLCSFIIGLPYENLDSVHRTFSWTQENDINTIWMPLFIRRDTRYKSDIDINYEKYGYRMGDLNYWENEYTNFNEARNLASEFQKQTNNTRTTWPLFAITSLGIWTAEELTSMRIKDMNMELVCQKRDQLIDQYKDKLKKHGNDI
jgi:MoaA/NifB/PqqE/SkfB family radical SAM enzyme